MTGRRAAPRRRVHPTRSTLPVRHPDLARFCVNRAQSFPDLETWTCVDLVPIWFRRRHAPFSLVSASIAPIPVATGSLGHTWQKNGKTIVTGASRVISVRSTGPAERSLSSMIGRVSLYSTSYERLIGVDNCCDVWPLGGILGRHPPPSSSSSSRDLAMPSLHQTRRETMTLTTPRARWRASRGPPAARSYRAPP